MFFLKYNEDGQDFSILTAYELRDGHVFPLDGIDTRDKAYSRYPDYQKYKDTDATAFLNEVREVIASTTEGESK